jgi:HD-GYP domain-containing protein (c-di-GMP phosphodiesterase class II)
MLLKSIHGLEPGEVLARPLRRHGRREMLLAAGAVLDVSTLERLARIGIRQAWIEHPGTEGVEEFLPAGLETSRDDLADHAGPAIRAMVGTRNPGVAYEDMQAAVSAMVDEANRDPGLARLVTEVAGTDDEDARHAVSVAHLSLLLGLLLKNRLAEARARLPFRRATDLAPVALCGLLHDAGRLAEPCDEDLEHPDVEAESPHCVAVRRLLDRVAPAPVVAGAVQHHQRYDGGGYPRMNDPRFHARSGEEIHVYARIVAVADHFDRRRSKRPDESRLDTLRWMTDPSRAGWFDPFVLRALPVAAPPFPPGTLVTLSTGPRAVVLRVDADAPMRPLVRVLRRGGHGREIDLEREPEITIVRHDGHAVPDQSDLPELLRNRPSDAAGREAA